MSIYDTGLLHVLYKIVLFFPTIKQISIEFIMWILKEQKVHFISNSGKPRSSVNIKVHTYKIESTVASLWGYWDVL